jgi:hypothetical protein
MSNIDEVGKLLGILKKQGKAIVTVNLVPYANDLDFSQKPPSCRVTVTVRDPEKGNKIIETVQADISTTTSPYTHQFIIPVETAAETFGSYFGFPTMRALEIEIIADPINGFDKWYESDKTIPKTKVRSGTSEQKNVSLKPTYDGSRLDRPFKLDKPSLRVPP